MSKAKKPISDTRKIKQIKSWNASDISKQSTSFRSKKVHFDTTTRFLDACINFYKDEISDLLKAGIDVNCADKDNLTAIHQACINSRIDLVEFLLQKRANINVCDKEGWTPLHIAADVGSFELAKFLIEHGARLDAANHDGDIPVMLVDEKEYPDLKIYFQKEMDKRHINTEECSNYERALMMEDVKKWKTNCIYDPPIDPVNKSTPLHVAASKNYVDILLEMLPLLSYEDINAQDIDGWTALHAAAHWGHKDACKLLIINGADIDIRTRANEKVWDTIDVDLKDELTEEINKALKEKEKLTSIGLRNETFLRSDPVNKRSSHISRSSIARQSVEWKKNAQMKDPAFERQTLIKANLNSESSGIITIEENDEKLVSPQNSHEETNLQISDQREMKFNNKRKIENESTNYKKCGLSEKLLEDSNKEVQLSNGDNIQNNASSAQLTNKEHNVESSDSDDNSEITSLNESSVKMRPKSVRDEIKSHRYTADSRLSLVMAPAKSDEAEVCRRERARRVRSLRRSTQAIDLGGVKEVENRKNLETIKSDSVDFDNSNDLQDSSLHLLKNTPQIIEKENTNIVKEIDEHIGIDNQNSGNSKEIIKSGRLNQDNVDSIKSPLKHQVSCPTSNRNSPICLDHARSNIVNKLNTLSRRRPGDRPKPIPRNLLSIPVTEKSNRGINVNKCIESTDFPISTEPINKFHLKNSDAHSILNTDFKKDSGSFVAKPVCGIGNKIKTSEFDETLKNKELDNGRGSSDQMEIVTEQVEDVPISKSILNRMLHDQTTKLELLNENVSLKDEIKNLKERHEHLDSTGNRKFSENDQISKLEIEVSKLKEDNQRLKSQNEALLRVISKIQQELETLR